MRSNSSGPTGAQAAASSCRAPAGIFPVLGWTQFAWRALAGENDMRIAFIGLGVMGYPMAGHLAKAGHAVTVHNRTMAKARQWQSAHGGALGETPAEAVRDAEIVCTCVGN